MLRQIGDAFDGTLAFMARMFRASKKHSIHDWGMDSRIEAFLDRARGLEAFIEDASIHPERLALDADAANDISLITHAAIFHLRFVNSELKIWDIRKEAFAGFAPVAAWHAETAFPEPEEVEEWMNRFSTD